MTTTQLPGLAQLDDVCNAVWRVSLAARNRATLIEVHMIARLIRDSHPEARWLVLDPSDENKYGWTPGVVLTGDGQELGDDGDLYESDGPTNSVAGMVADLEDDLGEWDCYTEDIDGPGAVFGQDEPVKLRALDLDAALTMSHHGGVETLLGGAQ